MNMGPGPSGPRPMGNMGPPMQGGAPRPMNMGPGQNMAPPMQGGPGAGKGMAPMAPMQNMGGNSPGGKGGPSPRRQESTNSEYNLRQYCHLISCFQCFGR